MNTLIYQEILSRGVEDRGDFRFAVHEAAHAIEVNLPAGEWSSDGIHHAMLEDFDRTLLWCAELRARIVEQAVCKLAEVKTENFHHWFHVSAREAIKSQMPYTDLSESKLLIDGLQKDPKTQEIIATIMDFGTVDEAAWRNGLKEGDDVVVSNSRCADRIEKVTRATKTQITITGGHGKFRRDNGRIMGNRNSYTSIGIAYPDPDRLDAIHVTNLAYTLKTTRWDGYPLKTLQRVEAILGEAN